MSSQYCSEFCWRAPGFSRGARKAKENVGLNGTVSKREYSEEPSRIVSRGVQFLFAIIPIVQRSDSKSTGIEHKIVTPVTRLGPKATERERFSRIRYQEGDAGDHVLRNRALRIGGVGSGVFGQISELRGLRR